MRDCVVHYGVGSALPPLVQRLITETDAYVDLTDATGVTFDWRDEDRVTSGSETVTVIEPVSGRVYVEMNPTWVEAPGEILGRYVCTFVSGKTLVVPNEGHVRLVVTS